MKLKKYLITAFLVLMSLSLSAQTIHELKAPLTFFITNDLGRNGYYKQKPIAELMGEMADELGPECIIAAGDIHHFMDFNLSYTFGRQGKTTIYAEATNLLNQPLRYYIGGNKDCTTQVEYYGAKVNVGVKFSL